MTDTVEQHLDRVLAGVRLLPVEPVEVLAALGCVLADDIVAEVSLPPVDNSAMDGYAVRVTDVGSAGADHPVVLPVSGEIEAGRVGRLELSPGTAMKIMTGAPVPDGADGIVPYEWTDRGADEVRIDQAPSAGQHIRRAGEDVVTGDRIATAGTRLGPRHVGLLAAVGQALVPVRRRPRVLVISTGSELRPPGQALEHGTIHDGNSYLLAAAVAAAGGEPVRAGIVPDSPEEFLAALREHLAEPIDLVLTSGGVSQGDYDVVKAALAPLDVWFGPVAMQPGKPQGFGLLDSPHGPVPILTLPGNPVSSYISFQVFGVPAMRAMTGHAEVAWRPAWASITTDLRSAPGRRQFARATYDDDGVTSPEASVSLSVTPVGGHGSHLLGNLAASDALIVVPEDVTELAAGDRVQVMRLDRT